LVLAGCASNKPAALAKGDAPTLGVLSRALDPGAVAATRTFYVAPNNQPSMSNSFVTGSSLQQAFADRIATRLVQRGLTQAPSDMADVTVIFTVQVPNKPTAAGSNGDAQGLAYADQLLQEAQALQTRDNFLDNDRLDMRIKMVGARSNQPIWVGSIAGVLSAGQDTRGRLLDTLDAVDRLLDRYPKVPK
jgi:hypothetical protein